MVAAVGFSTPCLQMHLFDKLSRFGYRGSGVTLDLRRRVTEMAEGPDRGGEGSAGTTVGGIETTISRGDLIYASVIAFLAWVVCVYDNIMFGTLLPKMADDFGWATAI